MSTMRNPWRWGQEYPLHPAANDAGPVVEAPEVKAPPPTEKPDQDTVTRVEVEHTVTDRVEVETVEKDPEPEKEDPELPGWLGLSTHAQLDRLLTERRIDQPDDWGSMTVARKKAWLDEYAG